MRPAPWLALAAAGLATTPAASGQSVLYTFHGDSVEDQFGISVSGAGDVNADGFADLVVGANGDTPNGPWSGSARVLSGRDGTVLHAFFGAAPDDLLGRSVSGVGDVNGDGYDDVIVGAPGDASYFGSATVFSGKDGAVLFTFVGDSIAEYLGISVGGAGDVNRDGVVDLIVGAYGDDGNGPYSGSARVFSGADGAELFAFDGDSAGDGFGISVSAAGDVDGDGYDDVIVGAWGDDDNGSDCGSARVFSGRDGHVLHTFLGDAENDRFGVSVSGAGDLDGDGRADVVVGAEQDHFPLYQAPGYARVFSGADGSVLFTVLGPGPNARFGGSVSGVADVNGDGVNDLVVGAFGDDGNGTGSGSATVFSGADGSRFFGFDGDAAQDWFGYSVSGTGDVDGDGHADLIVGAYRDDDNGESSGSARVFSGCDPLGVTYCSPAVPNSSGLPATIRACGSDAVAENVVLLVAEQLPVGQFGYFLASLSQGFVANPGGSQGNLCLGGTLGRFVEQVKGSGPNGTFTIAVDLAHMPPPLQQAVLPGETWHFQAWFRDLNPGPTSNFTDAVSASFQ